MKTFAGFWQRVGAFALDYVLLFIYLVVILGLDLLAGALSPSFRSLFSNRVLAQLIAFLVVTLPITLYFAINESSARRATWGKQRLGLQVANADGQRLSFWRAFSRTLLKFIPWELSHTLIWQIVFYPQESSLLTGGFVLVYVIVGLNVASLLTTKTHQTLYDLATRTYVIKIALTPDPIPGT